MASDCWSLFKVCVYSTLIQYCIVSLINVLHFSDMTKSELKVRTGASERYRDGEEHDIDQLIIHPDFKVHEYIISNDIGLVKVLLLIFTFSLCMNL